MVNGKQIKSVKPMKKTIQLEFKNLLSGFVTFAAAILILAVQGSLQANGLAGKLGILFMAASIPLGVGAYVIALKVFHSEQVPDVGHQMADKSSDWAIMSTGMGFMLILIDYNFLVFVAFLLSFCVASWLLSSTIKAWEKAELENEETHRKEEAGS
tara:strand:+ start:1092 stop:1559 length:468 start_codon:yes stop_codon:yes gene_type:complete